MARRRKNRTHLKGTQPSAPSSDNVPKSFVIKHGHIGTSLTQLTRDVRKVMEPNTATRLKVDTSLWCRRMLIRSFCASEGTLPEQAQGLFDDGAGVAGDPSPRVHINRYRTVHAHRAPVQWAYA
jgi:hypothetical protein